jgi:hypothetical protein
MRKTSLSTLSLAQPSDLKNEAILRCCKAWSRAYKAAVAQGRGELSCGMRANEAYRVAMPPLSSQESILDFLACVSYGLLVGTVVDTIATRLMYAAQVASSVIKTTSKGANALAITAPRPGETPPPDAPSASLENALLEPKARIPLPPLSM